MLARYGACGRLYVPYRWAPLLLISPPFAEGIISGNVQMLRFAAFATLFFRRGDGSTAFHPTDLDPTGRSTPAAREGALATIIAAFKVSEIHAWAYLLFRRPSAALLGVSGLAAIVLLTLPVTGLALWGDWVEHVRRAADPAWGTAGRSASSAMSTCWSRRPCHQSPPDSRFVPLGRPRTRCYSAPAVRIPVALYTLAVVVRGLLALGFPDPAYPDSSYYVDAARSIVEGRGITVDFVWIFPEVGGKIPANPTLPIPAFGHWMPLASFVQVPFLAVLGEHALVSLIPFILFGALAAPMTWALAREAGARPWVAMGAAILVAVPVLLTPFIAQPDNFGLYQPLVVGALWMTARGLKGDRRAFALAGLLAGFATLARNDGVLVLGVTGLAFLWDRWHASRSQGARLPRVPFVSAVVAFVLFLLVMAPWWARQLVVFGNLLPSTASGKVLFIRSITEWDSISTPANLSWLLGQGIGPLVESRIGGLVAAVTIFSVLVGGVVLAPFMVIGAWLRRRSVDFGPFLVYAVVLFAFSAIVSAVHVPGGTFIHSAGALAPHAYVLALEGIAGAAGWIAARRKSWDAERAGRVFGTAAVAFGVIVAVPASLAVQLGWGVPKQEMQDMGGALVRAGAAPDERVMSIDAAGFRYWTGHGGVVLVNDPLDTIEQVAQAYDIRWLALQAGDAVPSVAPILLQDQRPSWIGPAVEASRGTNGKVIWAVYPVCFSAADPRCKTFAAAPAGVVPARESAAGVRTEAPS